MPGAAAPSEAKSQSRQRLPWQPQCVARASDPTRAQTARSSPLASAGARLGQVDEVWVASAFAVFIFAYVIASFCTTLSGWFTGIYCGTLLLVCCGCMFASAFRAEKAPQGEDGCSY